jgi:hypothetical protein
MATAALGNASSSKVRHLLTGIQDNAVQPMVCPVLAMREDDKTFPTCLALFADFICHLKQNPSNLRCVAELGSGGRGSGKGHGAGGRDGGGRGHGSRGSRRSASEAGPPDQSEENKVTWLQANKYYTVKEYAKFSTQSSLQPRRRGFTSTTQSHPHPSAKLLLCRMVRTTPPRSQTTTETSMVTTTTRAYGPIASLD